MLGWCTLVLTAGMMVPDTSPTPTSLEGMRPITLPYRTTASDLAADGKVWFRLEMEIDAPRQQRCLGTPWAVYLPRINMNAAVYLNGTLIGSGGPFEPGAAVHWNRPLMFGFGPDRLRPGTNVVHVRLHGMMARFAGMGQVFVGPQEALQGAYDSRHFIQIGLSRAVTLICLLVALLMAGMWLAKGRDPTFGYLALASGTFAGHSLVYHIDAYPLPSPWSEFMVHASVEMFAVFGTLFFHRWLGVQAPRLEKAMLVLGGGGVALLAILGSPIPLALGLHAGAALLGLYVGYLLVAARKRLLPFEAVVVSIGMVATLLLGGHDALVVVGTLDYDSPRLFPLVGAILVVGFPSIMLGEVVRNERMLEESLASERTVASERARIMRELHDGMGAHLVSAVSMVRYGEYADEEVLDALRAALEEMRLVIDAVAPEDKDLGTLLGTVRLHLQPRLVESGLAFQWQLRDTPDYLLSSEGYVDVLRVVQEAITNIVKHAQASTISVSAAVEGDAVMVRIADDGVGVGDRKSGGRGLANMQARADRLNAVLTLSNRPNGGTEVALALPFVP